MIGSYFFLALRNLRKRRLRSWLTMIGIVIGIAAVVSLISLSQGMREAILSQFANLGADKLIVQAKGAGLGPPGSYVAKKLNEDDLKAIKQIGGIKAVAGRLVRPAKLEYKEDIQYGRVASIPQDESRKVIIETFNLKTESGRFLKKDDAYKVVLGNDYGHENIFNKNVDVGDKINIKDNKFEVIGILEKTGSFAVDKAVMINEDVMKEVFETGNELDLITVQVSSEKNIEKVAGDIETILRKTRDVEEGKEDFEIQTPEDILASLNSILSIVQIVVVGIASISIIVGGIGIMNTMYISVLERTKEIGIMKSIGAKNKNIFSLFFIESGLLGTVGGIIGIILGFCLSKAVEIFGNYAFGIDILKAHFNFILIFGALGFSFLIGTIAGTLPAIRASRLRPVDALRYRR